MDTIRAGLIGISGYTGMELARLLATHTRIELVMACSRNEAGKKLGEVYPFLRKLPGDDVIITEYTPEETAKRCDIVFLAVPAGTAMKMVNELMPYNLKIVDFSADFRLKKAHDYKLWYNMDHIAAKHLSEAVYGIPELYEKEIANARLVANPGCYPTATILGLAAALNNDLIDIQSLRENIIVDAISGVSGSGRKPVIPTLFCEVSDNFRAYGLPYHRHTGEIEQELGRIVGKTLPVSFIPHIVPMKRGIYITSYSPLKDDTLTDEKVYRIFKDYWYGRNWIRVMRPGELPQTINTRGSMFCDIGIFVDHKFKRLVIFSAIDNLCRGASGQALANANIMCGLPVNTGLENLTPLF